MRCEWSNREGMVRHERTYGDLLAQEIQVFLAVAQALLRRAEFADQELFRFGDGVREHDVGLGVVSACTSLAVLTNYSVGVGW